MFGLAAPLALRAQEVTVGPPSLFEGHPAVDVMPAFGKKLSPKFPREVRKSDEPGYVIVAVYVDEAGKHRARFVVGTVYPYEESVEDELLNYKVVSAKRDAKAVPSWFWVPVIFNPLATPEKSADAAPRLLEVTPIFAPKNTLDKNQYSLVMPVKLVIAASGEVTKFEIDPRFGRLQAVVEPVVKQWKFSPALKAGVSVEAAMTMSVVMQNPVTPKAATAIPPKPLKQTPPKYPYGMAKSGFVGEVVVQFTIDVQGDVQNVTIAESNHPGFNEAAVESVREWKFQPASVNGKTIRTRVSQKLQFELPGGGVDGYEISKGKKKPGAAASVAPDVAPKPRATVVPVFPYELLRAETEGSARIRMLIDERGRIVGVVVDNATHPEFGLALTAAAEAFAFDPALKAGKAVSSALGMEQKFKRFGESLVTSDDLDLLRRETKKPESIVSPGKLDKALKPVVTQAPKYPPSLNDESAPGSALIEFLIDEKGRARLPRIVQASHPAFGYAAAQAVVGWRFEPPEIKGKPVVVRVRLPFDFKFDAGEDKK